MSFSVESSKQLWTVELSLLSADLIAMAHGRNVGTSDYGTLPNQPTDTTICSNDSTYAVNNNSMSSNDLKPGVKIKAYVDFTEFNKNYEEYIKNQSTKNSSDVSDMDDRNSQNDIEILDEQSSRSSNQSSDWEVLRVEE